MHVRLCGSGHVRHTLCWTQFPHSLTCPTDRFCCQARCEMKGLLVLGENGVEWGEEELKKKKGVLHLVLGSQVAICPGSIVPTEQSCVGWRGDDQRPAMSSSSSSSILQSTAVVGSITLMTAVTKPHATEPRPLPDFTNYSEPLRSTNAASTDGRPEVRSFACLVKEAINTTDTDWGFLASGLKEQNKTF